jgi:putative SOS response-associated peptidase YedK
MVVVLREDDYDSWLHAPLEQVPSFLTPFPATQLMAEPAPKANRPKVRAAQAASGQHPPSLF